MTMSIIEEDYYEGCSNADSTGYLPQEIIDKYNIPIAPLSVTFDDGHTFTENDQFSIDDFYKKMASSKTIPTTSQPAIGEWLKTMKT